MSPQLFDGRIIRVINGNPQGYICGATKDPITGKVFVSASRLGDYVLKDTFVYDISPNENFQSNGEIGVFADVPDNPTDGIRTFAKYPPNKTAHLYCSAFFLGSGSQEISVFEVNPSSFDVSTVTWNNQPAVGTLVTTFTPTGTGIWYSFSTGTTGAICLKYTSIIGNQNKYCYFYATSYSNPTLRPYIT